MLLLGATGALVWYYAQQHDIWRDVRCLRDAWIRTIVILFSWYDTELSVERPLDEYRLLES